MPPEFLQIVATDVHAPNDARVKVKKKLDDWSGLTQGPLANMEAFSQDFNCAKGSAMNPRKKCQVNEILEEVHKYFAGLVNRSRGGTIYIYMITRVPAIVRIEWK